MLLELALVSKSYAAPEGGAAVEVLRDVNLQLAAASSAKNGPKLIFMTADLTFY